jgi:competence protein ComGC
MKHSILTLLFISILLLLTACSEETQEKQTPSSSSINPVDNYMDSRLDALDMAKDSVKQSNIRTEEQNKAMEDLTK